ncbi:Ig-like domain-containing protein [Robiginitalea myxolifaciens]|uniref:Ig-like domain-containing protein n=1 Tax=Robiginitalea myxolifaciens TaxID=400055 RepID=A0A1I6G6S0_9FLAO|nr:Ig-like domain-containing protein [Robiginitalea myxolifaciens]SFR37898.1 Ig-like domain-containing protein [Robiginitalea myxolifaciens]
MLPIFRRTLSLIFGLVILIALSQCGRRGNPTGGPKDETPPVLLRSEPNQGTTNFDASRIRLYFDEYIKLEKSDEQLIISPPMEYAPELSPLGGTSKYVEVRIKDTLKPETTYTLNFGQSVVDNNEGNPYNLLTYVFSTGDYLDSLELTGVVSDAYERSAKSFISVMLYALDSTYSDSLIYKKPPYYLTNTLDSAVIFQLKNLKAGAYRLIAIKDEARNNIFNPRADQIGFVADTVMVPSDTTYLLRMFREIPAYEAARPSFAASNRILFGYFGGKAPEVELLTPLPDSVRTLLRPVPGKDSLNFWFTPMEVDSLIFTVNSPEPRVFRDSLGNEESLIVRDTFSIKPTKSDPDSLLLQWNKRGEVVPIDSLFVSATVPLAAVDSSRFRLVDQDTLPVDFTLTLDTLKNRVNVNFEKELNRQYSLEILPGGITDFFASQNDTINTRWAVGNAADYGTLRFTLAGAVTYPVILELTNSRNELARRLIQEEAGEITFAWLRPDTYRLRVIFDENGNGRWDTGNFLERRQPENVLHFPRPIEMRANWDNREVFTIRE